MHHRLELGIFCTKSIRDSRCSTTTVKAVAKYLYTFVALQPSYCEAQLNKEVVKSERKRCPSFENTTPQEIRSPEACTREKEQPEDTLLWSSSAKLPPPPYQTVKVHHGQSASQVMIPTSPNTTKICRSVIEFQCQTFGSIIRPCKPIVAKVHLKKLPSKSRGYVVLIWNASPTLTLGDSSN
ncbi:hypothetical protein EVAR_54960_1 [Eumeta japonica]|uniref:Uncharacterized protein n=1 Tax=Eumeta variegata TaxID=151549 RepID=A0A4C1YMG0_EUMVA|nr:hypothetical protein EVAR_54960_1 [Eumeta japonica]